VITVNLFYGLKSNFGFIYLIMNQFITPEMREVLKALHYRPAVSIIMPFEAKINLETELNHKLKVAADKVELELLNNYPKEVAEVVIRKIRTVIKNLKIDSHKKSIVIYASLIFEKVIYLDTVVEEKIIVDDSFEIRDLVYDNKQQEKFLVLLLSPKECRLYRRDAAVLVPVEFDIPATVYAYVIDAPERVANFPDMQEHKQIATYKLLYHIDSALDTVLNTYPYPVFILGVEKLLGHFKKFTKHAENVIAYVHGNYEDATLSQMEEVLKPHIAAWKEVKQGKLLNQLEDAEDKKKLVFGMKDVWREATNHRGRLLVVEKNYRCAAQHGGSEEKIEEVTAPYNKFPLIRDAVDDTIEKILANGGDVDFVDENVLKDYQRIALIEYY